MLPTKLKNIIQYGVNAKSIYLMPIRGDKLMKQIIHGEDFGPDLFQLQIQPRRRSWSGAVGEILYQ